jgi:endonuclease/exonuclease/phosphatase (EEP) superfamily protein YafD
MLGVAGAWGAGFWPPLDILAHATPLYLLAGLGLAARLYGLRHARVSVLAGAGLLALLCALASADALTRAPSAKPTPGAGAALHIATCNIWMDNGDFAGTLAAIKSLGADIILLQEITGPEDRFVRELAADYPFVSACRFCQQAVLSKRPMLESGHYLGAWAPPDYDRLSAVWARFAGDSGGAFTVVVTQFVHPGLDQAQLEQMDAFTRYVDAFDRDALIVGGDANATPWMLRSYRFQRRLGLARLTNLPTWPDRLPLPNGSARFPFPFLPLDHLYAGPAWRVSKIMRGPRTGSDHYCVRAALSRAAGGA